jgi:hypothetical protein
MQLTLVHLDPLEWRRLKSETMAKNTTTGDTSSLRRCFNKPVVSYVVCLVLPFSELPLLAKIFPNRHQSLE